MTGVVTRSCESACPSRGEEEGSGPLPQHVLGTHNSATSRDPGKTLTQRSLLVTQTMVCYPYPFSLGFCMKQPYLWLLVSSTLPWRWPWTSMAERGLQKFKEVNGLGPHSPESLRLTQKDFSQHFWGPLEPVSVRAGGQHISMYH